MKIALIGECMVELAQVSAGVFQQGFGGDTLNTAVYMARLLGEAHQISYFTALGDDKLSEGMLAWWQSEGLDTRHVLRLPGKSPGLYLIETNEKGERSFSYWRDNSPARSLFTLPQSKKRLETLKTYDFIYLSGITLSLYPPEGRDKLFAAIDNMREKGGRFAFDTNFRPRGWPQHDIALEVYAKAMQRADILLASQEDLTLLYGQAAEEIFNAQSQINERIYKQNDCAVLLIIENDAQLIPPKHIITPVDTTAAGDSFAAAYCAARLQGETPFVAVEAGHALAFQVIQHRGAILPKGAHHVA